MVLLVIVASAVSQCYSVLLNTDFSLEDQDEIFNSSTNLVALMLIIRLA